MFKFADILALNLNIRLNSSDNMQIPSQLLLAKVILPILMMQNL